MGKFTPDSINLQLNLDSRNGLTLVNDPAKVFHCNSQHPDFKNGNSYHTGLNEYSVGVCPSGHDPELWRRIPDIWSGYIHVTLGSLRKPNGCTWEGFIRKVQEVMETIVLPGIEEDMTVRTSSFNVLMNPAGRRGDRAGISMMNWDVGIQSLERLSDWLGIIERACAAAGLPFSTQKCLQTAHVTIRKYFERGDMGEIDVKKLDEHELAVITETYTANPVIMHVSHLAWVPPSRQAPGFPEMLENGIYTKTPVFRWPVGQNNEAV